MTQHTVGTPYMVGDVHFYTEELEGGLALFDTGPPTLAGTAALMNNVDLSRLSFLFVTHCHVDHFGLTQLVIDRSDARIYLPRADVLMFSRHEERLARMVSILKSYGFDDAFIEALRESFERTNILPQVPGRYYVVEDSPELADMGVSVLACPGHSQSDLVYLVGDCAVSGDALLRNIFQVPLLDIDVTNFEDRFHNYRAWCESLKKFAGLRNLRVMPGHRGYIDSVDEAVLAYVGTLLQRATQVGAFGQLPLTGAIEGIFKGRLTEPFHIYLKASEIVFMRDLLDERERLADSLRYLGLYEKVASDFEALPR